MGKSEEKDTMAHQSLGDAEDATLDAAIIIEYRIKKTESVPKILAPNDQIKSKKLHKKDVPARQSKKARHVLFFLKMLHIGSPHPFLQRIIAACIRHCGPAHSFR